MVAMPDAVDEILAMLKAAWDAGSPPYGAGGNTVVDLRWPNDDVGAEPTQGVPWANVRLHHVNGDQYSLGEVGGRLFEHEGILAVQVFVPIGRGDAAARALCMVAKNAFEGKASPSGVWFRRCRFQDVGRDAGNPEMAAWDQTSFLCEFVYDERK